MASIDLEEIERLIAFRRAGALSDREFTRDLASLVEAGRPRGRGVALLIAGLAAGALIGAGGFWAVQEAAVASVAQAQSSGPPPRPPS